MEKGRGRTEEETEQPSPKPSGKSPAFQEYHQVIEEGRARREAALRTTAEEERSGSSANDSTTGVGGTKSVVPMDLGERLEKAQRGLATRTVQRRRRNAIAMAETARRMGTVCSI